MKSINNLKSKKDIIEALREVFLVARQTQIVYKKGIFSVNDLEIKRDEYETFSEETKDVIANLFSYSLNNSDLENYNKQLNKILDESLLGLSEDEQISKFRILIEGIVFKEFEEIDFGNDITQEGKEESEKEKIPQNEEEKDKMKKEDVEKIKEIERKDKLKKSILYIKKYYSKVIDKLEKVENEHYDEQLMIDFYRESKELGIHIDNEIEKGFKYGDFIKLGEETNNILYSDENMTLIRIANYQTGKTSLSERDEKLEKSLPEKISKYKFNLVYQKGKVASIEFFGESLLGDKISKGSKKIFKLMLSAACEAKDKNRDFIGRISCIDKDLGTFITTYDDNLEEAVQRLLKEEKMKVEKESSQPKEEEEKKSQQILK